MSRLKVLLLVVLCTLLMAACLSVGPAPSVVATEAHGIPVTGTAVVQSLEIQIVESQPLQANAIVRGELPDGGCIMISEVSQVRDGDTFQLTLATTTDLAAECVGSPARFEQIVPLDVHDLPPARYSVHANGVEQSFELVSRDGVRFKQTLLDALNARNYDLLRILMSDFLWITHWQSEGSSYERELAVEELKSSLLTATTPVSADHSKNLIELFGADPLLMMEPHVVEASPLFVSGWGADGRGESILFIARETDGSLYWHGLLFARDGFKPAGDVGLLVDIGVYATPVQSILAQQEVVLYNGPDVSFAMIGSLQGGQSVPVTGTDSTGSWWRVACPEAGFGSCWVLDEPSLTPTAPAPQVNPPAANVMVIPTISILSVARNDRVTILAQDFPEDTEFTVRMGTAGTNGVGGILVDRFNSGNGGTFSITFRIPSEFHGEDEIAIRVESSNGYYSYNFFQNAGAGTSYNSNTLLSTNVDYVVARREVNLYGGPSKSDTIIGSIKRGQRLQVTGMSADGDWWRVICPDGSAGSCWVSAKSKFTAPTD